jgi:hypothetical protein
MKKNNIVILFIAIFFSCNSKQELLIKEYEKNNTGTLHNKLEIEKINQAGITTAKDSFTYYKDIIDAASSKLKTKLENEIRLDSAKFKIDYLKYHSGNINDPVLKELYQLKSNAYKELFFLNNSMIEKITKENYKGLNETIDSLLKKQISFLNQDSIIGNIWDCTYTVGNNGQKLRAKYLFSPDNKTLLKKIDFN